MSLKAFHIVFVTVATLFSLLSGILCLRAEGGGQTIIGIVFMATAAALIVYGLWFLRKMKGVSMLVALVATGAVARGAHACTVCYGDSESAVILGAQQATLLMVGLTYFLLGGGVATFIVLRRRSLRDQQTPADGEGASS